MRNSKQNKRTKERQGYLYTQKVIREQEWEQGIYTAETNLDNNSQIKSVTQETSRQVKLEVNCNHN